MNRRAPEQDLERLLDADRGEFGAIYDRLARAEPPRRLDRAILAEASRAALGQRAPLTQRWLLGLGSAAGLVLAAGIAWQVGREVETKQSEPAGSAAPKSAPREVVPVQPIGSAAAPLDVQPPPPAIAPPAMSRAGEREAGQRKAEAERSRRDERTELAKPAPAPRPAARPAAADAVTRAAEQSMAPAAAEAVIPEAAAEPAPAFDAASSAADGLAGGSAAASAARPKAARERMPAAPSTSMKLRANMQLAPDAWIAEIRRLADAGQLQQAIENLRLFQRMHPDWPVDEDLRRLDE